MAQADNTQEDYLAMLKREGKEHTLKCGGCGVWWGDEHLSNCTKQEPMVVELTEADKNAREAYQKAKDEASH